MKVGGFTDDLGNVITPFTGTFTTDNTGVADTVQPIVLSTVPVNAATNVATNSTITLIFSKPLNPLTVTARNVHIFIQQTGFAVAGTYSLNNTASAATVTLTPAAPVPASSKVFVQVNNVQDYAGNNNQGYSFSFTAAATVDTTPPVVTSVTPPDNSVNLGLDTLVSLTFSKSVDPSTITANNIALFAGQTRLSFLAAWSQDLRTVTLSPGLLPENSTIQVVATAGVLDLSGNPLQVFQSQFTTVQHADSNRPFVVGQRPANGATQIPATAPVTLFLNKAMDPASTTAAMNVSQNGVAVAGAPVLSGNGQILSFTPASPLVNGSQIQIFLSSSALDTFGNQMNPYSGSFTVAPELSASAPVVTGTVPGQITARRPMQ